MRQNMDMPAKLGAILYNSIAQNQSYGVSGTPSDPGAACTLGQSAALTPISGLREMPVMDVFPCKSRNITKPQHKLLFHRGHSNSPSSCFSLTRHQTQCRSAAVAAAPYI